MITDRYEVSFDDDKFTYKFLSKGPKGIINKIVIFQELRKGVFNLAFGDWNKNEKNINDTVRSNNGDMKKVLETVAFVILDFLKHYPDAKIVAKGATPARTRLYQIGLSKNWNEIKNLFDIKGFRENRWTFFRPGENYEAFAVSNRKKM